MVEKMQGQEPVSNRAEKEIIGNCQKGDVDSFGLLVRKYQKTMLTFAYRMMGDWDEAKDVLQDTFVKAFLSIGRFDKSTKFFHWLYRILINQCKDKLRQRSTVKKIFQKNPGMFAEPVVSPERDVVEKERRAVLRICLGQLSETQRSCLILRDLQGLSCEEIAGILGCHRSTIRVHLFRARKNLKKILTQKMKEGKIDEVP